MSYALLEVRNALRVEGSFTLSQFEFSCVPNSLDDPADALPTVPTKMHCQELLGSITQGVARLNLGQCQAFNEIVGSTFPGVATYSFDSASRLAAPPLRFACRLFSRDASGGTGKSFLLNLIHSFFSLCGKEEYAMATSAAAAVTLNGCQTARLASTIPILVTEHTTCSLTANFELAQQPRDFEIIIRDEAVMCHCFFSKAVDRYLCALSCNSLSLGGLFIVYSKDFRQTMLVVRGGSPRSDRQCLSQVVCTV